MPGNASRSRSYSEITSASDNETRHVKRSRVAALTSGLKHSSNLFDSSLPSSRAASLSQPRPKRQSTLYDAVAGRVTTAGLVLAPWKAKQQRVSASGLFHPRSGSRSTQPKPASTRDTLTKSTLPLPPADVLFSRAQAPDRYEEPDIDPYGDHRWLRERTAKVRDPKVWEAYPTRSQTSLLRDRQGLEDPPTTDEDKPSLPTGLGLEGNGKKKQKIEEKNSVGSKFEEHVQVTLPDSDLLKALHHYASIYYDHAVRPGSISSYRSLDETALLAMGILVEEAAREALGETGWKALVEGEAEDGLHWTSGGIGLEDERDVIEPDENRSRQASRVRGSSSGGRSSGADSDITSVRGDSDTDGSTRQRESSSRSSRRSSRSRSRSSVRYDIQSHGEDDTTGSKRSGKTVQQEADSSEGEEDISESETQDDESEKDDTSSTDKDSGKMKGTGKVGPSHDARRRQASMYAGSDSSDY